MYKDLEAQLHDVFWQAEAPDVELELILDHLAGREGKCFEIGCGSGRILLPLNQRGFPTDGNDVSQDMLDLLEQRKGDVHCSTFCAEVTEIDVSSYQHFLVPAFTFMLMQQEQLEHTLCYLKANAARPSSLYFSLFMPWAEICGELDEDSWYQDHEAKNEVGHQAKCNTKFRIDRTYQILQRSHRYTYKMQDGTTQTQESQQTLRWYTFQEMCLLLKHTGWQLENVIYDLDPEANSENAHLFTFIVTTI